MDLIVSSGPSGPEKGGIGGKRILYRNRRKRRGGFLNWSGVYTGGKESTAGDYDREIYDSGRIYNLKSWLANLRKWRYRMSKKIFAVIGMLLAATSIFGCQTAARNLGGTVEIELEAGQKLEMITWKDESLWYLTRPMRSGEKAETHTFNQSSELGIIEGTVIVIESAEDAEAAG